MKRLFLAILFIAITATINAKSHLIEVGLGYSNTSVNTTIFRKNSIVSYNGWQFIAYYDSDGYVTLGKRKLGKNKFTICRTQYKGNVTDAHNIISIGIDGEGYLHVAFDHHNNKLHYCRSIEPYCTTLTEEQSMIGNDEDKVTYPEFYTLKNGDLLFVYRSGKSGQGNLVMNHYYTNNHSWQRVHDCLIDGEGKRNAYWQMCIDSNDIIHLSWVWRETWMVETNHDMCYAYSNDGGKTWYKSTGEKYQLPITQANAEYIAHIPQNSELINQTSIAADNNSRPYIASYWKASNDSAPQYKIIYKQNDEWKIQNVGHRTQNFSLSGGGTKMIPMSRPQIAVSSKGNKVSINYIYRDEETASKVTIAQTNNLYKSSWSINHPMNLIVDAWEPSYDTNLWNQKHLLHIFVQRTSQGDGEKIVSTTPQMVSVLEAK